MKTIENIRYYFPKYSHRRTFFAIPFHDIVYKPKSKRNKENRQPCQHDFEQKLLKNINP